MVEPVEFEGSWEDLYAFPPQLNREAGEYTLQDVVNRLGISRGRASRKTQELILQGKIESGLRYDPRLGKLVTAYWPRSAGRGAGALADDEDRQGAAV